MSTMSNTLRRVLRFSPVALVLALGACSSDHLNGEIDDVYTPPLHYQRYPIQVVNANARIEVPSQRNALTQAEASSVAAFAQQARASGVRHIALQYPTGAGEQATRVASILENQGIPTEVIGFSQYGGKGGPIVASYGGTVAQTAECGDWTANIARTEDNMPMPNFGCAHQQNLAAVVANPNDFITPRTETPPDAPRRQQMFKDYRTPKQTNTPEADNSSKVVISQGVQQ